MNRSHFLALGLFLALAAASAFAQQNPALITGKQGFLRLKADIKFGDTVLKPGTYIVQHEIQGGRHVLTFWQMGDPSLAQEYSDEALVGEPVGVPCNLERQPTANRTPNSRARKAAGNQTENGDDGGKRFVGTRRV
jgi:hypothetical protein